MSAGEAPRASFSERLYGLLLRLLPSDLAPHRRDALETYRDLRRATAADGGQRGVVELFLRVGFQAVLAALQEHWSRLRGPDTGRHRELRTSRVSEALSLLRQDVRHAVRGIGQRPTFSLAVVAILAFGIGATTAVFSVVDCVLLRPLPYPQAERLVFFDDGNHSGPLFRRWRDDTRSFESLATARSQLVDLTGDGPPAELSSAAVNQNFFSMFGAAARSGRLFMEADFAPGSKVAVLSDSLWRHRWGGDPEILGHTILLDGESWTVIGIMSPDLTPPEVLVGQRVDIWLPLDWTAPHLAPWNYHVLTVAGRLAEGIDLSKAQAELDALAQTLAREQPKHHLRRDGSIVTHPLVALQPATIGDIDHILYLLLGAVGLLLAIGCANVANLLLARGTDRGKEMALRMALGAGRGRLTAQLLVESLTLSLLAGVVGIGFAHLGVRAFELLSPGDLPRASEIAVDPRILAFAIAVSIATGILFGLAPALQAARTRVNDGLKNTSRGTAGSHRIRLRSALVVAEVAMALMLLVGAGLLAHSMVRLMNNRLGFEPEGLVRLQLRLADDIYSEEQRVQFTRDLLEQVEAIPGISRAAAGWTLPFDYFGNGRCCWRTRFFVDADDEPVASVVHPITPGYFSSLGAAMLEGRELTWRDDHQTSPVPVILNRTMADKMFIGQGATGKHLLFKTGGAHRETVVVGVVDDVRRWGLASGHEEAVYVPYLAFGGTQEDLRLVASSETPLTPELAQVLRDTVWALDPKLPIADIVTLQQRISHSLTEPRFYAMLLGSFALLSLVLAAAGIASSLLYAVGRRSRELGIRMAVGAEADDLLRLVLRQGMALTATGLVLGLGGAAVLSKALESMIYGITPTDPSTFLAVSAVLGLVALGACFLPALKAARTDPATTLRSE